jgi:RNA polymerase sigma factor (TIGR02999 family)
MDLGSANSRSRHRSRGRIGQLEVEMVNGAAQQITNLLLAWDDGDEAARSRLVPLVYDELRKVAARHLRQQRPINTLQTTALVNEAYLRLVDGSQVRGQDRAHFLAVSAHLMRRILVEIARERHDLKRGGRARQVSLDQGPVLVPGRDADLLALDEALTRLQMLNARQAQAVELRYFGGLNEEETAAALKVSPRTVRRDWNLARLWLYRELTTGVADTPTGGGRRPHKEVALDRYSS